MAPARPPSAPLTTNATRRYRRTLTPADAASWLSSRTACTRRPTFPCSLSTTRPRTISVSANIIGIVKSDSTP